MGFLTVEEATGWTVPALRQNAKCEICHLALGKAIIAAFLPFQMLSLATSSQPRRSHKSLRGFQSDEFFISNAKSWTTTAAQNVR